MYNLTPEQEAAIVEYLKLNPEATLTYTPEPSLWETLRDGIGSVAPYLAVFAFGFSLAVALMVFL